MQAIVFVARTGIVGLLLWLSCLTYLFRHTYNLEKEKHLGVLPLCYFFSAIIIDSIFQYVFSVVAVVGIVFVLLDLAYKETTALTVNQTSD